MRSIELKQEIALIPNSLNRQSFPDTSSLKYERKHISRRSVISEQDKKLPFFPA